MREYGARLGMQQLKKIPHQQVVLQFVSSISVNTPWRFFSAQIFIRLILAGPNCKCRRDRAASAEKLVALCF
jgi:hypothetical protein